MIEVKCSVHAGPLQEALGTSIAVTAAWFVLIHEVSLLYRSQVNRILSVPQCQGHSQMWKSGGSCLSSPQSGH